MSICPLRTAVSLVLAMWLLVPVLVHAQQTKSRDDAYFAGKLLLGVAGNADIGPADDDLETTYGLAFAYMHPLHRYFALGGEIALQSWQTELADDLNADRNVLGDLTIVPQGRLPITHDVELYLALPIGLTLDFFNGAGTLGVGGVGTVDTDPALGFTLSFLFGARFALSQSVGLLAELGYTLHSFSHDIDARTALGSARVGNVDFDLSQLALRFGVFF
jgi:hypothetical protein